MPVRNPRELFVMLLSDARQSTERSAKIYQEISQAAQDPDIKEALESRAWITEKDLSAIDRCFELIGEQPVKLSGRLQEVFVEDFRRELAEIQNPIAKHLFVLAKASHLIHLRIAEYAALVAAADWIALKSSGRGGRLMQKRLAPVTGRAALIAHSSSWPLQFLARVFIRAGRSPMLVEASTRHLPRPCPSMRRPVSVKSVL